MKKSFEKLIASVLTLALMFFYVPLIKANTISTTADIVYVEYGGTDVEVKDNDGGPTLTIGYDDDNYWGNVKAAFNFNCMGYVSVSSAVLKLKVTKVVGYGTKLYVYSTDTHVSEELAAKTDLLLNELEKVGESNAIIGPSSENSEVQIDITNFVNAELVKGKTSISLVVKGDGISNNYIQIGDRTSSDPAQLLLIPAKLPGSFQFTQATSQVTEAAGTAHLTVSRTGGTDGAVQVGYKVIDGSATKGSDYTLEDGTLSFAEGDTSQTIDISITGDSDYEENETIVVNLYSVDGGGSFGATTTATLTITDDDRKAGTLGFKEATSEVTENVATGKAYLTVERTGGTDGIVTVDYEVMSGGTANDADYVLPKGSLTFANGVATQEIPITIVNNSVYNADKTLKVHLYNVGGGGLLGNSEATLTIKNDDPAQHGSLNFEHSTTQVAENGGSINLKVLRTGGTDGAVSVDYRVTGGSASGVNDYTLAAGTLNFAEGESEKNISITIKDNNSYNADKTVELTLSNPQGGASIGLTGSTLLTIQNDDSKQYGTLQFKESAVEVTENTAACDVVVTRTNGADDTVTVDYRVTGGTAINNEDYRLASGTLTFPNGSSSQLIHIPLIDNEIYNGDKTVIISLSNPVGGASLGSSTQNTLTIKDDETPKPGKLGFEKASLEVPEGTTNPHLAVIRTDGTNGEVSVDYRILGGSTASKGNDYLLAEGKLTFGEGVKTQELPISLLEDSSYEPDETIIVELYNASGATLGTPTTATLTIKDNDQKAGQIAFDQSSGTVDEATNTADLTVIRTGGTDGMVSVDYAVTGGSATSNTDYTLSSGTLTFDNTEATQTILINIINNSAYSVDKTVQVTLSNPKGGATLGAQNVYTLTIQNDDFKKAGQLQFESSAVQIAENGNAVDLYVTRTGGTDGDVSVNYAVTSGTALNNKDYHLGSGTLTFLEGSSSKQTIHIPILDNAIYNGNKTVVISLSAPTGGATLGTNTSSTVTIVDNETPQPGKLAFDKSSLEVEERATTTYLKVVRTEGTNGVVSAHYKIQGGSTATNGIDYVLDQGTVTFDEGESSQTIPVIIKEDNLYENDETLVVSLDSVTGATLGAITTTTLTIKDNDQVGGVIGFNQERGEVSETTSIAQLKVDRVDGTDGKVSVNYAVTGGSAVSGVDYSLTGNTLTFETGMATQTLGIHIINNTVYSVDKTIEITLSHAMGGATLGKQKVYTLTIKNDDAAPTNTSGGGGGGGTTTPKTNTENVPVIIDGKTESIGQKQVEQGVTTITVNKDVLAEKINHAADQSAVIISVTSDTDKVVAILDGQNISNMIEKAMKLEVNTGTISYILPSSEINLNALGQQVNLEDLKVEVSIVKANATMQEAIQNEGVREGFEVIGSPIEFTVYVGNKDKKQEISEFKTFIPREIEISQADASKITTAIVYREDGTVQHRPTFVYKKGDKYYAKINSLTNSIYTLIENTASFKDTQGKWYEEAVTEMASRKIVNGVKADLYQGERSMTRAEFATIMVNALGLTTDAKVNFSDVPETAWCAESIATATQYGIIEGIGANKFNPNASITREEAMAMLQRAATLTQFPERLNARNLQMEFSDLQSISPWASDAVIWSLNNHLVAGDNGKVRPKDKMTRAEVAVIILRLLQQSGLVDVRSAV